MKRIILALVLFSFPTAALAADWAIPATILPGAGGHTVKQGFEFLAWDILPDIYAKLNNLRVTRAGAAPPAAGYVNEGSIYFNTTDDKLRYWDGGAWQEVVAAGGAALVDPNNISTSATDSTLTSLLYGTLKGGFLVPDPTHPDHIAEMYRDYAHGPITVHTTDGATWSMRANTTTVERDFAGLVAGTYYLYASAGAGVSTFTLSTAAVGSHWLVGWVYFDGTDFLDSYELPAASFTAYDPIGEMGKGHRQSRRFEVPSPPAPGAKVNLMATTIEFVHGPMSLVTITVAFPAYHTDTAGESLYGVNVDGTDYECLQSENAGTSEMAGPATCSVEVAYRSAGQGTFYPWWSYTGAGVAVNDGHAFVSFREEGM